MTDNWQDPVHAQFEPWFIPYISALPAGVTICVLLVIVLQFLPIWLLPRWLRMFVKEPEEQSNDIVSKKKHPFRWPAIWLLVLSVVGCLLQTITLFHPKLRIEMIFPAASWAFVCIFIVINRPATTPISLLFIYVGIFVSRFIVLLDAASKINIRDLPSVFTLFIALVATIIILNMPLRDPFRSANEISQTFSVPSSELRTPEDNLTLWQFMSVSWMAPLISLGNSRQLNDDDVWFLGFEFQHRILHDRFRDLQGTVLGRLLEANGLDLLIISGLSIIEQLASKTPYI
jgi:hypothetical protein